MPLWHTQTSWEPEEHLPPELITLFQQQNPQLFEQRVTAASSDDKGGQDWPAEMDQGTEAVSSDAADGYRTQYAPVQVKVTGAVAAEPRVPVNSS